MAVFEIDSMMVVHCDACETEFDQDKRKNYMFIAGRGEEGCPEHPNEKWVE